MRFGIHSERTFAKSRSAQFRLALLVLASCVQIAGAGVARAGAPSNPAADLAFAIADFDGDRSPDLAIVQSANSRNAVTNCAHTKNGSRIQVMPGARNWMIVAMKLTAPSSDDVMRNTIPMIQNVCPSVGIDVASGE